jgi:hypothetical protein
MVQLSVKGAKDSEMIEFPGARNSKISTPTKFTSVLLLCVVVCLVVKEPENP